MAQGSAAGRIDDDLPGRLLIQRALEDMASAQRLTQALLTWSIDLCAEAMDLQADCLEQWVATTANLAEETQAILTRHSAR